MPVAGGVLVRVTTQQWKIPDFTGHEAKAFLYSGIAASGMSPEEALQKWYMRPQLL